MSAELKKFKSYLDSSKIAKSISSMKVKNSELFLIVKPEDISKVLSFLESDKKCYFKQLISICGVDHPEKEKRFEVIYNMLSIYYNMRITVKIQIAGDFIIPTASDIFNCAIWYEREAWDMYGLYFGRNPDLRRILTDYNFEGHPLRKDFPLTGHVETRYDMEKRKVVYEPVTLTQEFRNFDFESPWEGADYVLPGDEKAS